MRGLLNYTPPKKSMNHIILQVTLGDDIIRKLHVACDEQVVTVVCPQNEYISKYSEDNWIFFVELSALTFATLSHQRLYPSSFSAGGGSDR